MQVSSQAQTATIVREDLFSHTGFLVKAANGEVVLDSFDGILRSYMLTPSTHTADDAREPSIGDVLSISARVEEGFACADNLCFTGSSRSAGSRD